MRDKRKQFGPKDIGAELLPIITRGLYRDPLDALREYIQNSIDAEAKSVYVKVTPDLVSIRDDGNGMAREVAQRAIRLGMSEKNPKHDIGFRGIGVYSAFNICDRLEIYSRTTAAEESVKGRLCQRGAVGLFDEITRLLHRCACCLPV